MEPSAALCKLFGVFSSFRTPEGFQKGIDLQVNSDDVVICSFVKSGSTWVQHICHQLRSGGNMDFDEIGLVVPCPEMAHDYGYADLQVPQSYTPRMFKTHLWYPTCPKGAGKYIYLVRRPSDTCLSFYNFKKDWFFKGDEISPDEFISWVCLTPGAPRSVTEFASQFHHIVSWYPHRNDDNVLWIHYEDLKEDLRGSIELIADFLNVGNDNPKLIDLVTKQASFEFMKTHSNKFDEHVIKLARNEAAGLSKDSGMNSNSKVLNGQVNYAETVLSKEILDKIQHRWTEVVTSETGYETYEAMRKAINAELGRKIAGK